MKKLLYYLWECLHGLLSQFMQNLQRQAYRRREPARLMPLHADVIAKMKFWPGLSVIGFSAWLINPAFTTDDLSTKQYLIL